MASSWFDTISFIVIDKVVRATTHQGIYGNIVEVMNWQIGDHREEFTTPGTHTFTVDFSAWNWDPQVTKARIAISCAGAGGGGREVTSQGSAGGGAGGSIVDYQILDLIDGDTVTFFLGTGGIVSVDGTDSTVVLNKSSVDQWKMILQGGFTPLTGGGAIIGGLGGVAGWSALDSSITTSGVWDRSLIPSGTIPGGGTGCSGGLTTAVFNGGYGGDSPFAPGGAGGNNAIDDMPGQPGSKGSGGGGEADSRSGSQEAGPGGDGYAQVIAYPYDFDPAAT